MYHDLGTFMQNELCLLHTSTFVDDDFGDLQAQATHATSYILWLKVVCYLFSVRLSILRQFGFIACSCCLTCYVHQQVPKSLENELLEKIRDIDLKTLLDKACPERSLLFNYFMS